MMGLVQALQIRHECKVTKTLNSAAKPNKFLPMGEWKTAFSEE
jgi:hypothetical protein